MRLSLVILLCMPILVLSATIGAEAATSHISVIRSEACKKSASCATISDLAIHDTSNQKISGKLTENGREKPMYRNHWALYKESAVFVEPDYTVLQRSKQIIIEPPVHMWYKLKKDRTIKNNTITDYHNRYIDSCALARISWDDTILADTIQFMQGNCDGESKYNEKKVTKRPDTKHKISESHKYKLEQYQKWVKDNCLKSRNACQALSFDYTTMDHNTPLKIKP